MKIDGTVIMWAFGLILGGFSTIVGSFAFVIWRMLNARIDAIQKIAEEDRETLKSTIKAQKEETHESFKKLWEVLDEIRSDVHKVALSLERQRADQLREFVTREECNARHGDVRRETTGIRTNG